MTSRQQKRLAINQPYWAYRALAFTAVFLLLHLYWAVGGSWGLPLAALSQRAAVQTANWVVSGIMILGMVWLAVLTRTTSRRPPSWLLLVPLGSGAVICLSHAIFGFISKGLYLAGLKAAVHFPAVAGVDPLVAAAHNRVSSLQDILVFELCFMLEGLLLTLAVHQYLRSAQARKQWRLTILASTVLICLLGVVLVILNRKLAIE